MDLFQKELSEARAKPLEDRRLLKAHLENLRRSGLSDDTIEKAGLATVSAEAAEEYLQYSPGSECLVFEYPAAGGEHHYRLKPAKPLATSDGDVRKYLAAKGSGNKLYVPPLINLDDFEDVDVPLIITEGEKKALKASQDGYCAVGIAGVWSWRTLTSDNIEDTVPLPEFDAIPWNKQSVYIVFDSDAAQNPDVQRAEESLAQELQHRGARVLIVRLPEVGGERTGLDDFLVQKGKVEFDKLLHQAAPLPSSYFQGRAFVPLRLANELSRREDYIYARDQEMGGGQLYRYECGVFKPAGNIGEDAQRLLGEETRTNRIMEAVDALKRAVAIDISELNPHNDLINVENGMLDPYTGKLYAHDVCYRSTIRIPAFYEPDAKSKELDDFLTVIAGKWEASLCELIGYLLVPVNVIKKLFILLGDTDSGKTSLINLVCGLLGPRQYANVSLQAISDPSRRFVTAELEGKLLNTFDDLPSGRIDDSSAIKVMTGGATQIRVERKHEMPYMTPNFCRHLYAANELPVCSDKNDAWYNRLSIFPFEHVLSKSEQKEGLREHFSKDEKIHRATLVKAVAGLKRLRERGWKLDGCPDTLQVYRQTNDPVMAFIDEYCNCHPAKKIKRTDLRRRYESYCTEHGLQRLVSVQRFYDRIRGDARFSESKANGERLFVGLELKGAEV